MDNIKNKQQNENIPKKKIVKKKKKKKQEEQPKSFFNGISFRFNNTISLTIMIVLISIVGIVEFIMYTYCQDSIKSFQNDMSSDVVSNISIFNSDVNQGNFSSLQYDLNNVLSGSYNVKYIVVLNSQLKEIYNSLPKDAKYIFRVENSPSSFKLMSSQSLNANYMRTIYVPKAGYHIYIGMDKNNFIENYIAEMDSFIKIFASIILICSIITSFMLAKSIATPLKNMENTVSKIANGDLSGRLDYTRYNEINQLVQSYNMMANALQRLYSTLESQVQDRTRELNSAYKELQSTQAMMVHSEKMKSLGELVAGIMHEINNPINFIYGNMTHLSNYSKDLIEIIEEYNKIASLLPADKISSVNELKKTIDYEFLKTDMPDLIKSCKEGAERAKNIIQDLKSFSRMEDVSIKKVDVVHELDTTLNILHNKIKNKAEVHKEYMENVPLIDAFGGQLNQVFMNILDNAVGAIEKTGDIWIRINTENNEKLVIEIEDNGSGMDEETMHKVFDPFFTTKPVGQGTGLGMSITHKIIKNHQGDINVESEKGKGTKFIIKLPLTIDRESLNASMISEGEA